MSSITIHTQLRIDDSIANNIFHCMDTVISHIYIIIGWIRTAWSCVISTTLKIMQFHHFVFVCMHIVKVKLFHCTQMPLSSICLSYSRCFQGNESMIIHEQFTLKYLLKSFIKIALLNISNTWRRYNGEVQADGHYDAPLQSMVDTTTPSSLMMQSSISQ